MKELGILIRVLTLAWKVVQEVEVIGNIVKDEVKKVTLDPVNLFDFPDVIERVKKETGVTLDIKSVEDIRINSSYSKYLLALDIIQNEVKEVAGIPTEVIKNIIEAVVGLLFHKK